jgi:hypothetical protein
MLADKITVALRDGHQETFSFREYLLWRESTGVAVQECDQAEHLAWLQHEANDIGRRDVWKAVNGFLRDQPHLASAA